MRSCPLKCPQMLYAEWISRDGTDEPLQWLNIQLRDSRQPAAAPCLKAARWSRGKACRLPRGPPPPSCMPSAPAPPAHQTTSRRVRLRLMRRVPLNGMQGHLQPASCCFLVLFSTFISTGLLIVWSRWCSCPCSAAWPGCRPHCCCGDGSATASSVQCPAAVLVSSRAAAGPGGPCEPDENSSID